MFPTKIIIVWQLPVKMWNSETRALGSYTKKWNRNRWDEYMNTAAKYKCTLSIFKILDYKCLE